MNIFKISKFYYLDLQQGLMSNMQMKLKKFQYFAVEKPKLMEYKKYNLFSINKENMQFLFLIIKNSIKTFNNKNK